jgi:outer membrane protein OmpA-like peptidoglycan-associated protein
VINRIDQTGPIGKLITIQLLPEHLPSLADGRLEVTIDAPDSDVGDGFAFDFVRLLINPKAWRHTGTVRGVARVAGTERPLAGVLVSAGNVRQVTTGADGRFVLTEVPAGLVLASGSHPRYVSDTESVDLIAGETVEVTLDLEPNRETAATLARQLQAAGRVDLYGIYFDTDRDVLKADSEPTLTQVLDLLTREPTLRLVVAGHTDAEGTDSHNQDLSLRRARAVVAWLTARGVSAARLEPAGFGESQPVADNRTPEGRALNRRVEIRAR